MHIGSYIQLVEKSEKDLALALRMVAKEHGDEPDVKETCKLLATWSEELEQKLTPFSARYGEEKNKEPDRMMRTLFKEPRKGSLALLRDLHDLWLMTNEATLCSIILRQAANALRDNELVELCNQIEAAARRQTSWLLTRMKATAPQTLVVAE